MHQENNWQSTTLGQVCDFSGGNGFREELQGRKSGDYPFIKVSDMELPGNKKEIVAANNWVDNKTRKKEAFKAFPKDSVVFAKVGAALLLNRRRILTMPTCIDNNMMAAVPKSIDSAFLFYLLSDIDFADFVQSGAVPSINQAQLSGISFDLPAPEEQHQIATILSTIDSAIEQTEAIITKQQRIKTGLMQDMLTRGIDEHGNIRSEETHEFKDSPLGRIPVEWEVKTIEQLLAERIIIDVQDGNHGELHPKSRDFVGEGIPFIMASDISEGFVDIANAKKISEKQYRSLRIGFSKSGDILLSHKASIGFVAEVPEDIERLMLTPQVTYYRIGNIDSLLPSYLGQFFRSECFQEPLKGLAKQSTRDYIGILAQRKLNIAYPSDVREQLKISSALSNQDYHGTELRALHKKLRSLKIGLMQDLLTGKKRVIALLNDMEVASL